MPACTEPCEYQDHTLHEHAPNFACESGASNWTSLQSFTSITRVRPEFDSSTSPNSPDRHHKDRNERYPRQILLVFDQYLLSWSSADPARTKRPSELAGVAFVTPSTHDRPAGRVVPSADVRIVRTNKRHDRSTYELISRVANDRESSRRPRVRAVAATVDQVPTRPARPPTFTQQPLQPNAQKPGPGPYLARPLEISWPI